MKTPRLWIKMQRKKRAQLPPVHIYVYSRDPSYRVMGCNIRQFRTKPR